MAGGASMGAATALFAAVRAPGGCRGWSWSPRRAWESRPPQAEAYEAAARLVERRGIPGYVKALQRWASRAILAEELPRATAPGSGTSGAWTRRSCRRSCGGGWRPTCPTHDELHGVVVPTLILAWTGDPAHPVSTAEKLAELMVMSELHVASDLAGAAAGRSWCGTSSAASACGR